MNIFSEVKEYLTARQVAENYGLQVRRNGLACCPFHDDKHPSMKIDKNYHCFACGVGGDAIDYVSRMFGLSQYEAALKIVEDFRLPIEVKGNKELSEQDRARIRRERTERERLIHIRERFDRWCNHSIESLRDGLLLIEQMGISHYPVCIAKTQYSFSADPKIYGAVNNFEFHIKDIVVNNGAEMIVAIAGEILRMPGLPKKPQAEHIDIVDGNIEGLS